MTLRDTAVWDDVELVSADVGKRGMPRRWRVHGVQYATPSEAELARLLRKMRIPFTPDVAFTVKYPEPPHKTHPFVPDFVFNGQAYVWHDEDGTVSIIHGIEVKGIRQPCHGCGHRVRGISKTRKKIGLLREQRGIVIRLLTDRELEVFSRRQRLPITPLLEQGD